MSWEYSQESEDFEESIDFLLQAASLGGSSVSAADNDAMEIDSSAEPTIAL